MAAPTPLLVVVLALLLGEFGCRRGPVPRRIGRGDRQEDVARRDLEQAILATDLVVIVQLETHHLAVYHWHPIDGGLYRRMGIAAVHGLGHNPKLVTGVTFPSMIVIVPPLPLIASALPPIAPSLPPPEAPLLRCKSPP